MESVAIKLQFRDSRFAGMGFSQEEIKSYLIDAIRSGEYDLTDRFVSDLVVTASPE